MAISSGTSLRALVGTGEAVARVALASLLFQTPPAGTSPPKLPVNAADTQISIRGRHFGFTSFHPVKRS